MKSIFNLGYKIIFNVGLSLPLDDLRASMFECAVPENTFHLSGFFYQNIDHRYKFGRGELCAQLRRRLVVIRAIHIRNDMVFLVDLLSDLLICEESSPIAKANLVGIADVFQLITGEQIALKLSTSVREIMS